MVTAILWLGGYLALGILSAWVVFPKMNPDFYTYRPRPDQIKPNTFKYITVLIWWLVWLEVLVRSLSSLKKNREHKWGPLSAFNQWLNRKLNVYEVD